MILDEVVQWSWRRETRQRQERALENTACVGWVEKQPMEVPQGDQGGDEENQKSGHMEPRGRWGSLTLSLTILVVPPVSVVVLCLLARLVGTTLVGSVQQSPYLAEPASMGRELWKEGAVGNVQ